MGMEKEKQEVLIEDIVAYLYLYLPIIIFLLTWIRPVFAYPVCESYFFVVYQCLGTEEL